jgi:glycosyltransferase involved in cell wall biosynthesis
MIQFSRVMNLMNPDTRWWPASADSNGNAVTVVTVSYNTAELTAMLLWSLHRVLDEPGIAVVVVDNGSTDGTLELLGPAAGTGYCRLLSLQENRGHGPALNHAFEVLAADRTPPGRVWILDSDCVVAQPEALRAASAAGVGAAVVGEPTWNKWHRQERLAAYSLLVDPARVWQPGIGPFADDGDPTFPVLDQAARNCLPMASFPFTAGGHLIHRGRGSLAGLVARGETANPLYAWAQDHHQPHYNNVPGAAERWQSLYQQFRRHVPDLDGSALAVTLTRAEKQRG